VHILATHPGYQRKGLGKRLLEYGCEIADREGAKVYLEASKTGLPLYESLGWEGVGEFDIDLGEFGGEEVQVLKLMVRAPK
jgi:GNAT superfamily N-acetyltransferase